MKKILLFLIISVNILNAQTIKLFEGFEQTTFPPTGWWRINVMGAKQWERVTLPISGVIGINAIQGSKSARIDYEEMGGDDWLITKKILNIEADDSLYFFLVRQYDSPHPPDSLYIKVSTTDSLRQSFTYILLKLNVASIPLPQMWRRYSVSLGSFSGQNIFIAFHHRNTNGNGCAIDSVVVYNSSSIGVKKIGNEIPMVFKLYENYPNPFNPKTNIEYDLAKGGNVRLVIYNFLGQELERVIDEYQMAGRYRVSFNGERYSSGVYLYHLQTESFTDTKRMILIK